MAVLQSDQAEPTGQAMDGDSEMNHTNEKGLQPGDKKGERPSVTDSPSHSILPVAFIHIGFISVRNYCYC